jgi:hypothetical protein
MKAAVNVRLLAMAFRPVRITPAGSTAEGAAT